MPEIEAVELPSVSRPLPPPEIVVEPEVGANSSPTAVPDTNEPSEPLAAPPMTTDGVSPVSWIRLPAVLNTDTEPVEAETKLMLFNEKTEAMLLLAVYVFVSKLLKTSCVVTPLTGATPPDHDAPNDQRFALAPVPEYGPAHVY